MCLAKIWPLVFLYSPHHLFDRFCGPQDGDFGSSSGGYQGRGDQAFKTFPMNLPLSFLGDQSAWTRIRRCVGPFRAAWVALGVSLFVLVVVYLTVTNSNATHSTTIISLKQRLIFAPPIFWPNWTIGDKPAERFPIGDDFVGASIGDRAVIWGGCQQDPGGGRYLLPSNVVYSFMPNDGFATKMSLFS